MEIKDYNGLEMLRLGDSIEGWMWYWMISTIDNKKKGYKTCDLREK